ncbi:MAG: hypothetical protein R2821_05835 [Flavobacteriaceae bacterium]|jgi:hypothetical protein
MKARLLNIGLLLSSLIGYLEWGGDKKMFLFQIEGEVLSKLFTDPLGILHPLTTLPLLGQLLLIISLFQKKPNKLLTCLGLGCIGILIVLIFFVGLISLNYKTILSAIPFLVIAIWTIKCRRING